jgi:hypothetical protein
MPFHVFCFTNVANEDELEMNIEKHPTQPRRQYTSTRRRRIEKQNLYLMLD